MLEVLYEGPTRFILTFKLALLPIPDKSMPLTNKAAMCLLTTVSRFPQVSWGGGPALCFFFTLSKYSHGMQHDCTCSWLPFCHLCKEMKNGCKG